MVVDGFSLMFKEVFVYRGLDFLALVLYLCLNPLGSFQMSELR